MRTETIRIVCNYDKEINEEIQKFCYKIANLKNCIELDTLSNGSRTEYKSRYDEEFIEDEKEN